MGITASAPPAAEEAVRNRVPSPTARLERAEAERIARSLKAIADPTRLQLLRLIQSAPDREACVCDLTAELNLRQPTVSHHLKTMTEAGLLTRERRGTWVWYSVDRAGLIAIQSLLEGAADAPAAPGARPSRGSRQVRPPERSVRRRSTGR